MRTTSSVKTKAPRASHLSATKENALKVRCPNSPILGSARNTHKKFEDENQMFQFSKNELESKIHEFMQLTWKNKSLQKNTPSSCLTELKTTFFSLLKESKKEKSLKHAKENSETINKELAFLFREAELQKKINELEESKLICEDKIENHAAYIVDLEKKVGCLIDEYEKTVMLNQTLMSEMQSSKHETSLSSNSDFRDNSNIEVVSEVESLRLTNSQLQNQIRTANENIWKLEDTLRRASLDGQPRQEQYTLQTIMETDEFTKSSRYFEEHQKEITNYQCQIEKLTSIINKNTEELDSAKNKCVMLEDELLNRCNLEKSHYEKMSTLEAQISNLQQENNALQALKEENTALISSLNDQVKEKTQASSCIDIKDQSMDSLIDLGFLCPKDYVPSSKPSSKWPEDETLEKALKAKEKELEDERLNHKIQIEKYTLSLTTLSGKVQILVKINENLTRDVEYLKQESTNYRTIIWSIYQEVKKRLNNYKALDSEIHDQFAFNSGSDTENLNFLKNAYIELRREIELVDYLLEERRPYI